MERVFSVGEISDPFWAPPPQPAPPTAAAGAVGPAGSAMNRCTSEWYFQKFLDEAMLDSPAANPSSNPRPESNWRRGGGEEVVEVKPLQPPAAVAAAMDPVEYNAMMRQKLEKDLAAVAMWRASGAMPPESSLGDSALPSSDGSNIGAQNYIGGNGVPVQSKLASALNGGPGIHFNQNADVPVKQASSSSSREPSDDEDMEGEAETMGNTNHTEEKVMRRKQSNRESARRSRSRRAAHLKELEEQTSQLRVENSSLLRRLADVNQKYTDAAVDNRVLKADVETLRAKVKMAEETVKRVTRVVDPLFPAISNMSSLSIPFNGSPSDVTSDAAVPIHDDPNAYFATANDVGANNGYMPEMALSSRVENVVATGRMDSVASLQRFDSLEPLQKRTCDPNGPAKMK